MKWLTKSDYLKYLMHPAYLWLAKHAKDKLPEIGEVLRFMFDQGNAVEAEALRLFPDGHLVDVPFLDGPDATSRLMAAGGPETLFQPSVLTDRKLYARADIMTRSGGDWDLYEVKGSTKVKAEHLHDLAFQRLAFEEAGHQIGRVFVIHVNAQYEGSRPIVPDQLFAITEVTGQLEELATPTAERVVRARDVIEAAECPSDSPELAGAWAGGWREIYRHLHPDIPTDSVYNLTRLMLAQLKELAAAGVTRLADIPDDFNLGPQQLAQVQVVRTGVPDIHPGKIAHALGELKYPLYFLDYETFSTAIPMWDGLRPYQQLPFQYSLHIIDHPGAELRHQAFLARGGDYPVPKLLEHLRRDLGPEGSVIVWNQDFEMSCNSAMAALHPEFADFLQGVNARVYDLMVPFASGMYAHPGFMGSASIKAVLPVLVPELSYKDLGIWEGMTAQVRWTKAARGQLSSAEAEQVYRDLEVYCGQDTLAMVRIWEHLVEEAATATTT
jgi:hypothetical protein